MDLDLIDAEISKLERQYQQEFDMDLRLDLATLSERTLLAPIMKQKWVARLSKTTFDERQLQERRERLVQSATSEFREKVKLDLSETELSKLREQKTKEIDEIDMKLKLLSYVKPYLEKMVNILSYSYTKDIENVIKWHTLETQ